MSCRIFMLIKIGSSLRILPYWARCRNCSLAVMKAELGTWPNLQFEMYSSSLNWSYEQMFSHMPETEPCRFEILHQECFLSATCPSSKVCMELIFLRCHLHEMLTNFIEVLSEVEFDIQDWNCLHRSKTITPLRLKQEYFYMIYGGFLEWGYPKTMGFNTNMVQFCMIWGTPWHLSFRNPPYN